MGDLSGKVAIVTGAGRGLGREEAMQLAKQGASVVISDIGLPDAEAAANETVEEIKAAGGEAIAVFGDCADTADSERLFQTALDTYGDVNIMVNNAGFCRDKTIFGMSDDEFDSVSVSRTQLRFQYAPTASDVHRLAGVLVDDDSISQGFLKLDLDSIIAIVSASSKRPGGSDNFDLHIAVRFPQQHHFWICVAGGDLENEPVWRT